MTPTWKILVGDVRDRLREIPDGSVQCIVTSPPYWGLRDYGTAKWIGGDSTCDHRSPTMRPSRNEDRPTLAGSPATNQAQLLLAARTGCGKCGAQRIDSQIGLEPTPEAYVQAMVEVFQCVWRVLKDDGTVWLNLGDSYVSAPRGNAPGDFSTSSLTNPQRQDRVARPHGTSAQRGDRSSVGSQLSNAGRFAGLKSKDLVGIPWRVAFALQADGWYLRSDIIWHKPNPMPESVTDRPTKAHEYIFLLTKNERYFYDAAAIAELASDAMVQQIQRGYAGLGIKNYEAAGVQNPSDVKSRIIANARKRADRFGGNKHGEATTKHSDGSVYTGRPTRNARTVWTITTQPYPEAHFATFPEAIPERCIKAGSRIGDAVLDPFCGSGTTGQVAIQLGRSFIGGELNPTYAEMARRRVGGAAPLFAVEA